MGKSGEAALPTKLKEPEKGESEIRSRTGQANGGQQRDAVYPNWLGVHCATGGRLVRSAMDQSQGEC